MQQGYADGRGSGAPAGYIGVYTEEVNPQNLAFMVDVSSMDLVQQRTAAMTLNPSQIARLLIGDKTWAALPCAGLPQSKRIELRKRSNGGLELTAENKPFNNIVVQLEKGVPTHADIISTIIKEPVKAVTGASLTMFMLWTDEPQSEEVEIMKFSELKKIMEENPKEFAEKVLFASLKNDFRDVCF